MFDSNNLGPAIVAELFIIALPILAIAILIGIAIGGCIH